jgi:glycosyltransferase involved in cell wall biosynthesis
VTDTCEAAQALKWKPEQHLHEVIKKNDHGKLGLGLEMAIQKTTLDALPLITVITIVFNGEKFLEDTILSVINQTYPNVEFILIDGGSSDKTLEIIKKYGDDIDYWVSEKDSGIYDAMNKGVNLAKGDWINFMNSGDCFSDNKILSEINFQDFSIDMIYGDYSIRKNNQKVYKDNKKETDLWKGFFCHQAIFIRSYLMKELKFKLNVGFNADTDLILRVLEKNCIIKKVNKSLCIIEPGGISDDNRITSVLNQWKLTRSSKIKSKIIIDLFFSYLLFKNLLVVILRAAKRLIVNISQ